MRVCDNQDNLRIVGVFFPTTTGNVTFCSEFVLPKVISLILQRRLSAYSRFWFCGCRVGLQKFGRICLCNVIKGFLGPLRPQDDKLLSRRWRAERLIEKSICRSAGESSYILQPSNRLSPRRESGYVFIWFFSESPSSSNVFQSVSDRANLSPTVS